MASHGNIKAEAWSRYSLNAAPGGGDTNRPGQPERDPLLQVAPAGQSPSEPARQL